MLFVSRVAKDTTTGPGHLSGPGTDRSTLRDMAPVNIGWEALSSTVESDPGHYTFDTSDSAVSISPVTVSIGAMPSTVRRSPF